MTMNNPVSLALYLQQDTGVYVRGKPQSDAFMAYVDGSSLNNPGPAGWAAHIIYADDNRTTLAGSEASGTNNQMELTAAIEALQELPKEAYGTVFSDSEYVVKGVNVWRKNWEKRGWRTASGQPVANAELWRALHGLVDQHPGVSFQWIRGHAGNENNEFVDTLARAEAGKVQAGLSPGRWKMEGLGYASSAGNCQPDRSKADGGKP